MELTEEEARERAEREDNLVNLLIKHKTMHDGQGRKPGDSAIPKELKSLIALTSEGSTQKETAELFNVSQPTVRNIQQGKVSEGKADLDLLSIREKTKEDAGERALANLKVLLDEVPSRIAPGTKLREISAAAKDMASVHEKLSGRRGDGSAVNVLIYAPRIASENKYKIVEVEAIPLDR